jgi:hypothetical protein
LLCDTPPVKSKRPRFALRSINKVLIFIRQLDKNRKATGRKQYMLQKLKDNVVKCNNVIEYGHNVRANMKTGNRVNEYEQL